MTEVENKAKECEKELCTEGTTATITSSSVNSCQRVRKLPKDRHVKRRPKRLMTNPISIALMIMWAFACEAALVLIILADVFQSQAPAFPLVPTMATSIGLSALCAFFTALLGRVTLQGFCFYQPFAGGQAFIVMQGFGYGTLVVASLMLFVYVESIGVSTVTFHYGTLTVLGCFSALANIGLMTSLLFFVSTRHRKGVDGREKNNKTANAAVWWCNLSASPNAEMAIVVLLCVAIFGCFLISEYSPDMRRLVSVIGAILLFIGLVFIHVLIGHWYTPGYRLFMPNAGSFGMSMMQAFGWILAGISFHVDMILYKAGPTAFSSWHILCGLSSVISLTVLLLFVRLHRFSTVKQSGMSLLGEYGPLVLTVASVIYTAIVWGISVVLSSDRFNVEPQLRQGLVICQTLCSLLIFALPPCTHLLGRIAFGKEYEVWMPFKGPLEFMVLQSLGWTCFGVAICFFTLQITENLNFNFVIIGSSFTALSQAFVHASLHLFDEGRKPQSSRGKRYPLSTLPLDCADTLSATDMCEDEGEDEDGEDETSLQDLSRSLVTTVLNGEMLTAILLSIVGFLLRVVADVSVGCGKELYDIVGIPTKFLIQISTVIMCCVVPLAHISMRAHISVWQPFVGSGAYVAMQSIGWSLYCVVFLMVVTHSFLDNRQSLLISAVRGHYVRFEYTMEGLFGTTPLVCIIMGAFFETQVHNYNKISGDRTQEKVCELFSVLKRTISDEGELRQAESLLKAIAGPHWIEPVASDNIQPKRKTEETVDVRQEAATQIVTILSVASGLAFVFATFFADSQPVFTLVFGAAGVTLTTISCFSVHCVYGTLLHRVSGRYSFFMPFSGGTTFVVLQAFGWSFYTVSTLLIALSCAEGRGFAICFATAGIFSVIGQHCILQSVQRFDPTSRPTSLLERNAEGIVAVLALIISFAFAVVYDLLVNDPISGMTASLVPITLMAVSTCFAVPLGLLSLRRNAKMFAVSSYLIFDNSVNFSESDEEFGDEFSSQWDVSSPHVVSSTPPSTLLKDITHRRHSSEVSLGKNVYQTRKSPSMFSSDFMHGESRLHRNNLLDSVHMTCFMIASFVAILLSLLIPFAFCYIAYCYVYSSMIARHVGFTSLNWLLCGFGVSVMMPLFVPGGQIKSGKTLRRRFISALCCYVVYSIPTAIVVGALGLPLVLKTMSAWVFAASMVVMSCISTIPHVHLISMLFNVCVLGYFLHYHFYICLRNKEQDFTLWKCIVDIFLTAFWLWYFRRYLGQPHISGCLCSNKVRKFFHDWIFNNVADYFDLNVIVDGKEEITEDKAQRGHEYVDLNIPENKYLFSFHPHGILPGSAMWVPNTECWEGVVGQNKENYISSHSADVVFAVPMLRDVILSLGGLSVSRRAIESSLLRGNSVLLVTGGQAEMLLSKYSDTEMHLVTHHTGFIRLAMAHQVPLVPVLCFAEHNVMSNISFPRLQRYSVKKLGFPFPTIPFGKWYLPLPNALPLTVVVGRPLCPEPGMDSPEVPEHVKRYKQRYFEELGALFFKYRGKAGYPNMTLALHHNGEVQFISEPIGGCEETQQDGGK